MRCKKYLAAVFATQSAAWSGHVTADGYWTAVKVFAAFVSDLEHVPKDLDGLTAAILKRWRARNLGSTTGNHTLGKVRALLRRDRRLSTGLVAEELARRVPASRPTGSGFSEAERKQMVLAAQRQFRSALLRIRENTQTLQKWRGGALAAGSIQWRIGEVLDHIARTGDVPRSVLPGGQLLVMDRCLLGGQAAERAWGRLFLTRMELTALAVLLTDRFAWNLSVYDRLPVPSTIASAGETSTVTYQVQIEKRRAGDGRWFSTENITDSSADSPGRLITHALEATAHGRALAALLAPGTDLLMVARTHQLRPTHARMDRPRPAGHLIFGVSDADAPLWGRSHGLGGSPFRRSRRATVTREQRPMQHTQSVFERAYVLPDEHVQHAARDIIAAGAAEALGQAQAAVFGGELIDQPEPGHEATATADCADQTTSPWPAPVGVAARTSCSAWPAPTPASTPAIIPASAICTSRCRACAPP